MKKFILIFIVIGIIVTINTLSFGYTDIENSNYKEAILSLSESNIVNGYEDDTYRPNKVVTRAEIAKLLIGVIGGIEGVEDITYFRDVPKEHWANGFINQASQYGLIKGDGDGKFRPDDTVNYAEASTMILRAFGYGKEVEKSGEWPTNYLSKANELKLFENINERFESTDGATRGTVAQMFYNIINKSKDTNEQKSLQVLYSTPTGKRYHFSKECAGDNAIEISLTNAEKLGLTPCKKCAQ